MRTLVVLATFATAMVAGRAAPLGAQNRPPRVVAVPPALVVVPHHDLTFGTVLPGVPARVNVLDARAALFELQGPAGASVRIEFLLPHAMTTTAGDRLPLDFGSDDGFADVERTRTSRGLVFDPANPLIITLSDDGRLWVRLGGTAVPALPQAGGAYRGTIVITVSNLGI